MYGPVSPADRWHDTQLSWFRKFLWNVSRVDEAGEIRGWKRLIGQWDSSISASYLLIEGGGPSLLLSPHSLLSFQVISFASSAPSLNSCLLLCSSFISSLFFVFLYPPPDTALLFFSSLRFFSPSHLARFCPPLFLLAASYPSFLDPLIPLLPICYVTIIKCIDKSGWYRVKKKNLFRCQTNRLVICFTRTITLVVFGNGK